MPYRNTTDNLFVPRVRCAGALCFLRLRQLSAARRGMFLTLLEVEIALPLPRLGAASDKTAATNHEPSRVEDFAPRML